MQISKIYILPLLLLSELASAQMVSDIVRFSNTTGSGSARSAAMGGALGALGGDLSNIGVNPAGTGVFDKTEFSITPFLNIAKTKSDNRIAKQSSLQLGTFGGVAVFHNRNSNWRSFNFGINYNNLNNFNRTVKQNVDNSSTSFTEILALEATHFGADGGRGEMTLNTGLITYNDDIERYEPTLLPGEEVNQYKYTKEDGYQGEYNFSFGTNYKDKLYMGVTFGVQNIRYKSKSVFTGKGDEANFFGLDKYDFGKYLEIKGVGTNFKFGMIYCPIPELRLGAAIHTPMSFSTTKEYSENARSVFHIPDGNNNFSYESYIVPNSYHYDMRTPWKAVFSVATILMQKATLSFDYEYTDYTSARCSKNDDLNDEISSTLKAVHHFRVGAEYRVNSILNLRGGYSCQSSPYKISQMPTILKSNPKIQAISAGFGINSGIFFCDAAYVYRFSKDITNFYHYEDPFDSVYNIVAIPLHNKYISHEGRLTVGVRF